MVAGVQVNFLSLALLNMREQYLSWRLQNVGMFGKGYNSTSLGPLSHTEIEMKCFCKSIMFTGRPPYNGLYGEAPPKRGTVFRYIKGQGFHKLTYMKG